MKQCYPLKLLRSLLLGLYLILPCWSGAALAEDNYLDISLVLFETNIPESEAAQQAAGIYPRIRQAESRYLPFYLRELLANSGRWGAVRVVPGEDLGADLLISGSIQQSDGNTLAMDIKAVDSRGHVWLERRYQDSSPVFANQLNRDVLYDPFQHLHRRIAQDLEQALTDMSPTDLDAIRNVAMLRYAANLVPDAFQSFLVRNEAGMLEYQRLPAEDDPLLARIMTIRDHEYLFIDTVDEQYRTYFTSMKPIYDMWRQYSQEQIQQKLAYDERLQNRRTPPAAGTYEAYRNSYNNFRFLKLEEQYMQELSQGFDNELRPTAMSLETSVVNLNGSLEHQYQEWQEILRAFYLLETGGMEQ